jgi:NAD(P)-dependent dehydrogenase (short-subunit alcohol dehydrogenase family)
MRVENKSVLITGASRGLGFALARALSTKGARVVLVARDEAALAQAVETLRREGAVAHAISADVGDSNAAAAIAAQAAAAVGPVEVLIHNASDLGPAPLPLLLDTARDDFRRVLEVNLLGPFALSKALVGPMVLRGEGLVVHISSDAAVEPYPRWGAYGASKAALEHLSRIWARELASTKVRVLSIDPGEMDTQMHRDAIPEADPTTLQRPEEVARRIVGIIESDLPDKESGARLVA